MSAGQGIGAVVGATIGFFVGGPAGALYGAQIGAAVGGYLDPPKGPTVQGPRLSDLSVQTSTYGTFIPRVYGTIGIHGNLLWLENNQLKETVRKKKQGGKGGGGSTTVKTYSYSATFALALCQGPIAGIRRIWCADKLIYNAGSDDLETIIASNQAAQGWRLYLGTDDQLPDTRYEADVGVGNASAFRGIAYLAFYDFQLADYGNTLQAAQFKFEVVTDDGSYEKTVLSEAANFPGSQVYVPGRPGGFLSDLSFAGSLGGDSTAWRLNQDGVVRQVSPPGTGLAQWFAEINAAQSLDAHDHVYVHTSFGTERLLFLSSSGWDEKTTPYDLVNFRYYERNGHMWFQWTTDNNNTGTSSSGSWLAKVFGSSSSANLEYNHRIDGGSFVGWLVPMVDGDILYYDCNIPINQAGVLNVSVKNEVGVTVKSFSAEINARAGQVNREFSRGYQSSDGVVHIVFMLYREPNPLPTEFGKFYYVQLDVVSASIIKQGEVFFEEYVSLGSHINPDGVYESDGVIYIGAVHEGKILYAGFMHSLMTEQGAPLSEIIYSEFNLSSLLTSGDIIAAQLSEVVKGYRVQGGTIRAALEPLQGAFPFDVIQSGYQIKCVPRGQSPVATIPWEDLGATDSDTPGDLLQQSREMDTQLPARTTIKYLDAAREYATSEQYAERINTEAVNRVDRELPLVLTADEAAGVAEVLQFLPWLERTDAAFTLPPTYLHLEPSDVITVTTQQASYPLRLTEINYTQDGRLECKAKPNRAALYTPNATGGEGVPPSGNVPLLGPTLWLPLDIPVVDETIQNSPGFATLAAGSTSGWPGAIAFRSLDSGQTWSDLQGYTGVPTVGNARGTLPASACTLIDQRSLVVDLIAGELESITRDQMLAGQNYAAYGADGRWEIVRFQNATLQGDGSYLVSHFVRGERGTEWATGLHQADDYFVLLDDPDNVFIDMAVGSIGVPATYRGVTLGSSIDSASDVPFTYQGVNLECLSPVYTRGTRDGSSNFSGTFTRRSRLSSSWWANGVEAPLGETTQAYEIDVMSGATVKRTISVASPAWSYSAADQTADFGSTQASITFRIHQLSSVVGRGYPLEVTL